jgi:ferredoxin
MGRVRIDIDPALCIGSGLCVGPAQGAIVLVSTVDGPRAVPTGESGDPDGVMRAARCCPTLAIALADEAGRIIFPPGQPDSQTAG